MKQIVAAFCLSLVGFSAVRAEDEFIFRLRKVSPASKATKPEATAQAEAAPAEDPYRARKGDTLWDVAGRFWSSPGSWPELWSLNPHLRNPHRIDPGDPIYLSRGSRGQEVHLPMDRLESTAGSNSGGAVAPVAERGETVLSQPASPVAIRTARARAGHSVSSHRIPRLGTVSEQALSRNLYATGDDVALRLSGDAQLKPGDWATVFDDSLPVAHPVNGTPQGYLVRVLGHLRVQSVSGRRAIGQIVEAYDAILEGAGVMAYRKIPDRITPLSAKPGVEGVILSGMPEQTLMGMEEVVFLDRGTIHGLGVGAVLDVPIPATHDYSGGLIDLRRPIARILVISVEDKTATGLILANRISVLAGQRFVASALSP